MTLNNLVAEKLNALHKDAEKDYMRVGKGMIKSVFRPMQPIDFKNAYLPISKNQGEALHQLIVNNDCKHIVEFGTSFGISTIYLAHAAKQTNGKVTTTELLENKALIAQQNIKDAGLSDFVEVRIGDAMKTLQTYNESIDLLFLDGWKDLYLPVLQLLEDKFHSGTLIYSDNMDMGDTRPLADYLLSNTDRYSNKIIHGGKAFLSKVL